MTAISARLQRIDDETTATDSKPAPARRARIAWRELVALTLAAAAIVAVKADVIATLPW